MALTALPNMERVISGSKSPLPILLRRHVSTHASMKFSQRTRFCVGGRGGGVGLNRSISGDGG